MSKAMLLPLLVLLAFVVVTALMAKGSGKSSLGSYKRRPLMTENELEFFGRLVVALPDHYIFPQVGMTALLDAASSHKRVAHSDRLRVAQQRVDYLVCNKRCEVVAAVELDDRTHNKAKDQVRDTRLAQGGIRTVRFQARQKPGVEAIRNAILGPQVRETTSLEHGAEVNAQRNAVAPAQRRQA